MKKIIVIKGSPRKGANSDTLCDAAVAAVKDAEIIEFAIRDKKVNPCVGCNACKGDFVGCVQKDDFSALVEDLRTCDGIILSAPIYFGDVPGPVKTFIDRQYCLFNPAKGPLVEQKERKMAVILTNGGMPLEVGTQIAEKTLGCFNVEGITDKKILVVRECNDRDAAAGKPDALKQAEEVGAWF
ncbi:MAG: flavodoxin family protein [Eubacterium sp.]|nr:flavodoxin family protein [Eubacterium sp.]